jgi:hypothetical protein
MTASNVAAMNSGIAIIDGHSRALDMEEFRKKSG